MSDIQSVSEQSSVPQENQQTPVSPNVDTAQQLPPDFVNQFQQHMGMSVDDFKQGVGRLNELEQKFQNFSTQQQVDSQLNSLKGHWGVQGQEFDNRLSQVREYFSNLSPEEQKQFDNVEGAQIIWQRIQNQQPKSQQPSVPTFLGSNSSSVGSSISPSFTESQIKNMPKDEYVRRQGEILEAYRNGKVLKDLQ